MNKYILILLLITITLNITAQKKAKKKKSKTPENIEVIATKFSFSPIYTNEYTYLVIKNRQYDEANEMKYKPNISGGFGGKIQIKNITVAYIHSLQQPQEYGKTEARNFIFNFQKRIFGMKLYWTQYNGLYMDTLDRYGIFDDIYRRGTDKAFIIRPDIKLTNIGFQTHFVFTKSFSINAALEQTERQKKTAGSFMLLFGGNYMGLQNDKGNSLILPSQQIYYPRVSEMYKLNAFSIKIAPGIGYSFIIEKYFSFSVILMAGPSVETKWYKLESSTTNKFGPWLSVFYQGKAAFGYNGEKFMANIIYSRTQDVIGFNKKYEDLDYNCKTNIKLFREFFKLSFGVRIL